LNYGRRYLTFYISNLNRKHNLSLMLLGYMDKKERNSKPYFIK